MKNFRFKFEMLLKWKKNIAQKKKMELSAIIKKELWFAQRALSIEEEIKKALEQLTHLREGNNLEGQKEMMNYIETLRETLKAVLEAVEKQRASRVSKQQEVERAIAERKGVEILRESHYTWARLTQERKEEAKVEELRSSPRP